MRDARSDDGGDAVESLPHSFAVAMVDVGLGETSDECDVPALMFIDEVPGDEFAGADVIGSDDRCVHRATTVRFRRPPGRRRIP
ncbi:hypothetical protein [Nocardia sp. NBC_01388]|uniref:hypothetical protein n=1 Tax=Nocardia sp. NBC_01388 TaxID=2903596 RepID=UPI003249258D